MVTDSDEESTWSGESGRRADSDRIIGTIERKLARLDVETISDEPEQREFWSWNNPRSRKEVRDTFGNFYQQESLLPGFGPAGYGNNAHEDCGEAYPFLCSSCEQTVEFGRTCSQLVCMRCGVAWIRDSAIKKTAKLRRLRIEKNQHTSDKEHQKIHHGVISPPLAWYRDLAKAGYSLEEANDITKEIVKEILDELRV